MDNFPAFPVRDDSFWNDGMTLRDWFAGQALSSAIAAFTAGGWHNPNDYQVQQWAATAYAAADAMLSARVKPRFPRTPSGSSPLPESESADPLGVVIGGKAAGV